ncbi:asparagine synthetase B, partial [Halolamina salina]
REPLHLDAASDGREWSFDPTDLTDPELLDALTVIEPDDARGEVWSLPNPTTETDHGTAVDAVRDAVLTSVREPSPDGLAVAFSGGV